MRQTPGNPLPVALVAILVEVGCGASLGTTREAPRPECRVELISTPEAVDGSPGRVRVKVSGREVLLDELEDGEPQELRVYSAGPGAVFIAYAGQDEREPYGGSTLWRVPCEMGEPEPHAHLEGADFGHSVLSADGRWLYFTGPDGVYGLDLATRAMRRLTRAALAKCDENHVAARDVVMGLVDPGTLSFERGCGYEREWIATPMLLRNLETPALMVEAAPKPPPSSVAIDAGGGVWLSDGRCVDRTTFNYVLFSADHGDHWSKVPVRMYFDQPVREVIADRVKPGALLVWSFGCASSAHRDPGWVYLTEDGGATFLPIAVPPGIRAAEDGTPAPEQDPIEAVLAIDGKLDHLILFGGSDLVIEGAPVRWESLDGGRTWKMLGHAGPVNTPSSSAAFGDWVYAIRRDGLYRTHGKAPSVRVYPRD